MISKESIQEEQYYFPYHHLSHVKDGSFYLFRHLFWGLEHYTYIQFVISEVTKHTFNSLADIGCGEGRILSELANKLPDTILKGYDTSASALHFARGFSQKPIFAVHDITSGKIADTVDAIISCEVIEHIKPDQVDNYCKYIAASLNENGLFFVTTPTTNIPVNKKHYQHFTKSLLESHLLPYFTIEEVVFMNKQNFYSRMLSRIIANRFYLSNMPRLNQWALKKYEQKILFATEESGSRIYIRARKR